MTALLFLIYAIAAVIFATGLAVVTLVACMVWAMVATWLDSRNERKGRAF